MTDATERTRLRRRNLDAFRTYLPSIVPALESFKPAASLKFAEDGQPDIVIGQQTLYGGNIDAVVAEQVRQFKAGPSRLGFRPEWAVTCMAHADPFGSRLMEKANAAGLAFGGQTVGLESPTLAIFGIGLGRHIQPLVEASNCRHLFLADSTLEFMYHALETVDWAAIAKGLAAKGGGIHIHIGNEAPAMAQDIVRWLRHSAPMAFDGTAVFFHSENPDLIAGVRAVGPLLQTALLDLGFFYDESLMLRNAVVNLRSGDERVYRRSELSIDGVPAFVVGTGPSLDKEFEFLRRHKDKAVIVSAGTALRSLLLNGIVPDIQIETENIDVEPVVSETAKQHPVRDIPLVASTTTDPAAVAFFEDVRYFHRVPLTPTQVFCDDHASCFLDANITVGNAAIAFAQEMGFRDIYFFGMDMGSRVPSEHHSKDSYHYIDGAIVYEPDLKFDIERPANFGGVSYTSLGLSVAMRHIEHSIARYGGAIRHFNCSDGSAFKGATAKRSADILIPDAAGDRKAAAMSAIFERFPEMPAGEYALRWNADKARDACRAILSSVEGLLVADGALLDKSYMSKLMNLVGQPAGKPPVPFRNLYGGSILQMFIVAEFFLRRVEDPAKLKSFEATVREELRAALTGLDGATDKLFAEIAAMTVN